MLNRLVAGILIVAGMTARTFAGWFSGEHAADRMAGGNFAMASSRTVMSLDGAWQIAEGSMEKPLSAFDRSVPVPGLVSLATPSFVEPGSKVANCRMYSQKDPRRDAFWYRRTFKVESGNKQFACRERTRTLAR